MHGKKGGDDQASPREPGRTLQQQEQQYGVHRMKQQTYIVMTAGVFPKQLPITRMRKPGQRMPVRLLASKQRPFQACPVQPSFHVRVIGHVKVVVEIDESVVNNRVVERQRDQEKQQGQNNRALPWRREEI